MFNVKKAAVCASVLSLLIGAQAYAVKTAPKVRETVRGVETPGKVLKINPAVRTGESAVNALKAKGQEAANTNSKPGQTATLTDEKGEVCSMDVFASKLSQGTSVSYADALKAVELGLITQGTCAANTGAVLGYDASARNNLLVAVREVMRLTNGKSYSQMSVAERADLDVKWAKGLALAKGTTEAAELQVAKDIKNNCNLRR